MASVFDYIFKIGGNFTAQMNGMSAAAGDFTAQVAGADSGARKLTSALATFSYLKDVFQNVADGFSQLSSAGITLDSQMHDLSAVAGVTGEGLKQIETFARESAKAFGTDAAEAVEGYKLLLSQLTPELGKYPEALREMGDCIQTTSKLMGGDGVAAAQVLTTAMNQYGVSMEDPTAAAGEMARMMNVMAAAGQAGSAELPAISAALQQCGMAAKAANVSFEETNAAIQVLDKAGKKASEGGVALRNVLGQLSKGRFVEKQAREELEVVNEIREVFSKVINYYTYNDLSKKTENTFYNISRIFNDGITSINNYTNSNICFNTFSYGDSLTVKPDYRTINFVSQVCNISNVANQTKTLNYSYPQFSEINKYFNVINPVANNSLQTINRFDLPLGKVNNTSIRIEDNKRKEKQRKGNAVEFLPREKENAETYRIDKVEIEEIVTEMFRREVEICSY